MGGLDLFDNQTGDASASPSGEGAWSVVDLTQRARQLIEAGLRRVWVRGEVSGFKAYRSGHWYFTLRDRQAQVRCVMWQTDNRRLGTPPEEGLQVYLLARPTVWEERGEFRLTVKQLIPTDADGLWQLRLEQAKAALLRDGLLEPARKRPLPHYPGRIAVVTSTDGAALRDIISVVERRWPGVELWVVPTPVQGEAAEPGLCSAIALAGRIPGVDITIVGRGGGSREDLWAFNCEPVARAVAALPMPTISAVGHETDVTLTDLVADVRAPTPSAAAEEAVPDRSAVEQTVGQLAWRMAKGLTRRTELGEERLARTGDRLWVAMQGQLDQRANRLGHLGAKLDALSPLKVLERGYSVARDESGRVLKRTAQFHGGLRFRLTVADGDIEAEARIGGR